MPLDLVKALGLKYPLIVAPMAGAPQTAELVAAASGAGALGSIGAAYLAPAQIEEFAAKVRTKTNRPFNLNLFVPSHIAPVKEAQLRDAIAATQEFREEWGLPAPKLEPPYEEDFDRQFAAMLEIKPEVFSFVFGTLGAEYLNEAKKQKILTIGAATTLDEARALEESGVDAIVLQGLEAGGHRAIFDSRAEDPNVPLVELLKTARPKIKIPLIAAGGIMKRDQIAQVLRAGADLVQMGTAFLATEEAGTSPPYRQKLAQQPRVTRLTRAFSGRLARGIENRFMNELRADAILPFPAQNKFTRDIRKAGTAAGSPECDSLWCGTGQGELWTGSVRDLIRSLFS